MKPLPLNRNQTAIFLLGLSIFLLLGSILAFMNRARILLPFWRRELLGTIQFEEGFAYMAYTNKPELSSQDGVSPAQVWEDGAVLPGPSNSAHDSIRKEGFGTYSFWQDYVLFSASDNSDPRVNGRAYEMVYPVILDQWVANGLYGVTILSVLSLMVLIMQFTSQEKQALVTAYFPQLTQQQKGVSISVVFGLSIALLVLALLTFLNRSGLFTPFWKTSILSDFYVDTGFLYEAGTGHPELSSHKYPSQAQVLENGRPLVGPANALHEDIRTLGQGQYSFWYEQVFFSTSDNSDPRINGRVYSILYPLIAGDLLAYGVYVSSFLLCLASIILAIKNRDLPSVLFMERRLGRLWQSIRYPHFFIGVLILLVIFLVTRLPFFLYYSVVGIQPDSHGYLELAQAIRNGTLPLFSSRTPGYPLFISFVTMVADRLFAVILVQNLISFAAYASLLYGVYRLRRSLFIVSVLAVAGYSGSSQVLIYDTTVLSESLFASCIIFSFAFLLLALGTRRPLHFALSSAFMAGIILVRPAGMYVLVIFILVIGYMLWNRFRRNVVTGFGLPLPALLLLLCLYNYFTIHLFTISPWGGVNVAHATILYWEPDPSFPPLVNEKLAEMPTVLNERVGFTKQDRQALSDSWDFQILEPIFEKGYTGLLFDYTFGNRFVDTGMDQQNRVGYNPALLPVIKMVSYTAIQKHPDVYVKFVLSNCIKYFKNVSGKHDFYGNLIPNIDRLYVQRDYSISDPIGNSGKLYKEYADAPPPNGIKIARTDQSARIIFIDTKLKNIHVAWETFHNRIFHQPFWSWAFLIVWILGTAKFLYSKGKHLGGFVLFILTTTVIGSCLVTSLVEPALERYAYPTQFIYYLSLALSPLLWIQVNTDETRI